MACQCGCEDAADPTTGCYELCDLAEAHQEELATAHLPSVGCGRHGRTDCDACFMEACGPGATVGGNEPTPSTTSDACGTPIRRAEDALKHAEGVLYRAMLIGRPEAQRAAKKRVATLRAAVGTEATR